MKYTIILILFLLVRSSIFAQPIPYGQSIDTVHIITPQNTMMYYDSPDFQIYYYKPSGYNSLTSPILWYVHGTGGSGADGYTRLHEIADRRNALVVAPTMQDGWLGYAYVSEAYYDIASDCFYNFWYTEIFKQIYRHILQRESRDSIPVYLTGFSAGGQFVTRYILIKQFNPDSIPIVMSASVDPANYTLCTDKFLGDTLEWFPFRCGLAGKLFVYECQNEDPFYIPVDSIICNAHIKQYYNENYAVLIGTLDTVDFPGYCPWQGGADRYERAIAFYNFSDTNAINRGTTLKWQFAEIPGVGHNSFDLYSTPATGDSIPIAERILFETPWHPIPHFIPTADFSYSINDTTQCVEFNANCNCLSQGTPTTYLWNLSNGFTATGDGISVDLSQNGIYNVQLIASNIYGSDTIVKSVTITGLPVVDFFISDSVITFPDSTVYFTFAGLNADSLYWDFGDGSYSNSINPTHTYQDSGSFTVTLYVFNGNNCVDSATKVIKVENPNGINLLNANNDLFQVFPNPTKDNLTISSKINQPYAVVIYNSIGQLLLQDKFQNEYAIIDMHTFLQGIYFLKIITDKSIVVKKIVKE